VIKVEARQRPDGTRGTGLFDLLNAGKECIALDFRHDEDRRSLGRLLEAADIVIEGFRPRVMENLGIFPEAWLEQGEGRVWLSISGYGRTGPGRNWIAFGDDAAVAGGAATVVEGFEDSPVFCGDAIADPVGGLYAAIAVMAAWNSGLGHVIDVALREAIGHAVAGPGLDLGEEPRVVPSSVGGSEWALLTSEGLREIAEPRARMASSKGSAVDEDGRRLRTEFSL
jgi:crotonobetainyl-CoA:carnitine CoA-transferase CaiB-like acyl-CoA transferase